MLDALNLGVAQARHVIKAILLPELGETGSQGGEIVCRGGGPRVLIGGEHVEPKLWHWHGYKPSDVDCWLNAIDSGAWPERSWRALPNCKRGRCKWKPIVGSGCRYFGRITMKPCYLRTYVYMLAQHRKLLELADSVAGSEELELDSMRGRVRELQKELREVEG